LWSSDRLMDSSFLGMTKGKFVILNVVKDPYRDQTSIQTKLAKSGGLIPLSFDGFLAMLGMTSEQLLCYNQFQEGGTKIYEKGDKTMQSVRWIARIGATLMAGMILIIFIGEVISEGFGPLLQMSLRETAMMAVFIIVFMGLILGWRWEMLGGLLIVGGMAAFYLLDFLFSGTFPRGPFLLVIVLPGLLYVYSGLQNKAEESARD